MQSEVTQLPLQDQLLTWFDKNKRQLLIGGSAAIVVGIVAGFYVWRQNQVQTDASEALSKISSAAYAGGTQTGVTESLLKLANDYPGTDAARRALLLAAGNHFTEGKYKEAQTQFEKFLRDYRDSSFASQALLGVASCKDAQGMVAEATAGYKDIVDHHASESVAPHARFALGRLYETQGKPEFARDLYQVVQQSDPNGALGAEAGMRLAELFSKHPNLIPASPTPAGIPAAAAGAQP